MPRIAAWSLTCLGARAPSASATVMTWNAVPNNPPTNVAVAAIQPSVYLGGRILAQVTFSDEGTIVLAAIRATGKHGDDSDYAIPDASVHPEPTQQLTRHSAADPWTPASFTIDVPADLKEGAPIVLTALVTDSDGNVSTPVTASVNLLADPNPPTIVSLAPKSETHYTFGNSYDIALRATDAESGIAHATVAFDVSTIDMRAGAAGSSYDSATGVWPFRPTSSSRRRTRPRASTSWRRRTTFTATPRLRRRTSSTIR